MKKTRTIIFAFLLALPLIINAQSSNEIQTNGKICSNPFSPCGKSFQDNDISFRLPSKLTWGRNYYSASFYAIILKSRPAVIDESPMGEERCSQGYFSDAEREKIQNMFPVHKVFASRNGCYMSSIWYTNANNRYEFTAVFAGSSEAEATRFLKKVKAKKEFSGANMRKMKVVYGYSD